MNALVKLSRIPAGFRIGLVVGWILIALKCIATPWIIAAWQVPVHPAWVIVPTLVLAALVTGLIVAHDWSSD